MKTNRQTLSEIMRTAWQIFKATGKTFSESLKKAWLCAKLKFKMHNQIVEFHYEKINGDIRQAFGTLQDKYFADLKGTERKKNDLCLTYFDTEKNEFRSFKKFNILTIK